jgi:hypothetical protein
MSLRNCISLHPPTKTVDGAAANDNDKEKLNNLEYNKPQSHSVHHKYYMN